MEEIKRVVEQIIIDIKKDDNIIFEENTDLFLDYGMDSIGMMGALVRIENALGIEVPDELLITQNIRNYGNFIKIIYSLVDKERA